MMKRLGLLIVMLGVMLLAGCVERMITVTTDPPGAVVWLNDEEIGSTPVTREFTWYGTYDVTIRKEGFETLHQGKETPTPIYQWPVLDLFFETLWPGKLTDHHPWHFALTPVTPNDPNALIERAEKLRSEVSGQP